MKLSRALTLGLIAPAAILAGVAVTAAGNHLRHHQPVGIHSFSGRSGSGKVIVALPLRASTPTVDASSFGLPTCC